MHTSCSSYHSYVSCVNHENQFLFQFGRIATNSTWHKIAEFRAMLASLYIELITLYKRALSLISIIVSFDTNVCATGKRNEFSLFVLTFSHMASASGSLSLSFSHNFWLSLSLCRSSSLDFSLLFYVSVNISISFQLSMSLLFIDFGAVHSSLLCIVDCEGFWENGRYCNTSR